MAKSTSITAHTARPARKWSTDTPVDLSFISLDMIVVSFGLGPAKSPGPTLLSDRDLRAAAAGALCRKPQVRHDSGHALVMPGGKWRRQAAENSPAPGLNRTRVPPCSRRSGRAARQRSAEHTSEHQSLMRNSYAAFYLII